ncbi:Membrane protein insertase YidC [Rubripirellula lacrimiformis]|uniref:Membrane protein insertase YidC n=1 Tax=Rubripirellula lacrimiformis TaxID=1930273 RepID=A0A517N8G5_9BACT|nr:YidC/Oxa1 family insertase periplasmic-domain containing protein [Rubripirellula lacrimiformis]QDT03426.1 Membrane protein insertase YidC [Rubripirellula lacrimiformis]
MERRLLTFIVSSTAFFLVYMLLREKFAPQPEAPPVAEMVDPAGDLLADADPKPELVDAGAVGPTGDKTAPDDASSDEIASNRPTDPEWITLGSMAADSGYHMLVTLNTRGAGIERIELTERDDKGKLKYHRVDIRIGYLGYLAAESATTVDGVVINVVGPGTPAQIAGLKVGDIITSIDGKPVTTRNGIDAALEKSVPGDQVDLEIVRSATQSPETVTVTLSQYPLDVVRLARDGGTDQIEGNLTRQSCLMLLSQVNRKSIDLGKNKIPGYASPADLIWSTSGTSDSDEGESVTLQVELSQAEMEAVGGQSVRLQRTYAVKPADYSIDMQLQVDNLGDEAQDLSYRLEGPNGVTLEGWWYSNKISPNFSGAAARDVVYNTAAEDHELVSGYELLKLAKKTPENPYRPIFAPDLDDSSRNLRYIGIDAQYFAVAYVPSEGVDSLTTFRRCVAGVVADPLAVPKNKERAVNASFVLDSVVANVPPGGSIRQELQMFAGPKDPEVLEPFGLGQFIYYGWFERFAKLLGGLLHLLSGVGNYALAIILLTVIVRGCMFPLSRKAAINAQKMQELAPELKKIAEKHKDDMEGRMKAQRELQQRVGFNPMAGCLPMFLQLPIFIGLYRALSVDIELRQQPVFSGTDWASNLAGPDMLAYWGDWLFDYMSGRGTGWLGPYFNILPVLVVGLFLAQQKMFMPPATDEQTAMTQKMMNVMTLMMGLFFFRVPAGLCIYFITSSLWGIGERILVKKTLPKTSHFDTSVLEGSAVPTDSGSSKPAAKKDSLVKRIQDSVKKPEPTFERPNKRKRPKK